MVADEERQLENGGESWSCERLGPDFSVRASRIDGDLWEVGADPL